MSRLKRVDRALRVPMLALLLICSLARAAAAEMAPNEVARLLAGLPPEAGTHAPSWTENPAWQGHARAMDAAWQGLEHRQLANIRAWVSANLTAPKSTLLYFFSGPDFLYANALFPAARTYVLAGLEPVGRPPSMADAARRGLSPALAALRASLSEVISYGFFVTRKMKQDFAGTSLGGTLPVLYVFLARAGFTIKSVVLVQLDSDGQVQPAPVEVTDPWRGPAYGAQITLLDSTGEERTLYYLRTDISDNGLKSSGLLPFLDRVGPADSLVKSASYLLHESWFSTVRQLLLTRSSTLVQDDSGVPLQYFPAQDWELKPFGRYLGPIGQFPGRHQPALADLYRRTPPARMTFGIGYRWQPHESNLLLAVRRPPVRAELGEEARAR